MTRQAVNLTLTLILLLSPCCLSLDAKMLLMAPVVLQGLAFLCSAASLEGEGVRAQAEGVVLALLSHPLPQVQQSAYGLMEQLAQQVGEENKGGGVRRSQP